MLQVSQYIYLEEHLSLAAYGPLASEPSREQDQASEADCTALLKSLWTPEEELKSGDFCENAERNAGFFEQAFKENISPNLLSPLAQRKPKTHQMSLRPRLGSGSVASKRRPKRRPLQPIKQSRAEASSEEERSEEE